MDSIPAHETQLGLYIKQRVVIVKAAVSNLSVCSCHNRALHLDKWHVHMVKRVH